MINQMICETLWRYSHTANCAFKSDMGCSPNNCFQNIRLYLCPRRPCSLKWWHTTGHQCLVVCCTMLGCVQVGSVVWRVTREHWPTKTANFEWGNTLTRVGQMGRPCGPSKWYGTLRYAAVIYGIGTDRFVSGVIIIQVIFHRPFSQQSYAINYSIMYAYFFLRSINLSVIIMIIYTCIYVYMRDTICPHQ